MASREIGKDFMANAVLFSLTVNAWGNRKKCQVRDDKGEWISRTKRLVASDEFDALKSFQNATKKWIANRCMPSFLQRGIFVVKLENVARFEEYLTAAREELRTRYVGDFLKTYGDAIEEARRGLSEEFDAADYPTPSRLRETFDFSWNWLTFRIPDNLPEDVRAAEIEKLQRKYAEAQDEILSALRASFAELVEHLVDRLTPDEDGKPKTFTKNMLPAWNEFFDTFGSRNLLGDDALEELVTKARAVLAGVTTERLRARPSVKRQVLGAFEELRKAADSLVKTAPSRRFDTDED